MPLFGQLQTFVFAGYQPGELNEWSKKTNTELAAHIPLIIRVPWELSSIGRHTMVKAELVDLYRTRAELSGLSSSAPEIEASVQGTSLAAVFKDPIYPMTKPTFSQIGRCSCEQFCPGGPVNAVS